MDDLPAVSGSRTGGQASGISVDLVNLAARRRGIRLEWVYWNNSSESALVSKSVDLWPLITITPERLKVLHISEPYLRHEHCLLVRDDAPYTAAKTLPPPGSAWPIPRSTW